MAVYFLFYNIQFFIMEMLLKYSTLIIYKYSNLRSVSARSTVEMYIISWYNQTAMIWLHVPIYPFAL
jgi:hypothetical protein